MVDSTKRTPVLDLPRESPLPAEAFGHRLPKELVVSVPLDPYLPLRALASYSGLSVRRLRQLLDDRARPLPRYRVGGKILVRRSEFDQWMVAQRDDPGAARPARRPAAPAAPAPSDAERHVAALLSKL